VKWYSERLGYGFVKPMNSNEEIFLHVSVVKAAGLMKLFDGQLVSVVVGPTAKGKRVHILQARKASDASDVAGSVAPAEPSLAGAGAG
jgi:CspA family cold shock protein